MEARCRTNASLNVEHRFTLPFLCGHISQRLDLLFSSVLWQWRFYATHNAATSDRYKFIISTNSRNQNITDNDSTKWFIFLKMDIRQKIPFSCNEEFANSYISPLDLAEMLFVKTKQNAIVSNLQCFDKSDNGTFLWHVIYRNSWKQKFNLHPSIISKFRKVWGMLGFVIYNSI